MHNRKMHMYNERESVYVGENPMGFDRLCSLVVLVGVAERAAEHDELHAPMVEQPFVPEREPDGDDIDHEGDRQALIRPAM